MLWQILTKMCWSCFFFHILNSKNLFHHNDPKFLDRQAWANSVDPAQTAPGAVWSMSTLFAILSVSVGHIILWQNHIVKNLGSCSYFFGRPVCTVPPVTLWRWSIGCHDWRFHLGAYSRETCWGRGHQNLSFIRKFRRLVQIAAIILKFEMCHLPRHKVSKRSWCTGKQCRPLSEPRHEKTCFSHMRTTKVQISLCIRAGWSAPLLFAT